jgi:hypothetical protein
MAVKGLLSEMAWGGLQAGAGPAETPALAWVRSELNGEAG